MNPHKVYAIVIIVILAIGSIVGVAAFQHAKDDAHRDAVIDAQKSGIEELRGAIAQSREEAAAKIAALEKQKQVVVREPQQAPQIIRELIPMSQPIAQTAPLSKETPPDAPSAVLTKRQEIELAQYAEGCKQCVIEREQLAAESSDQKQIIAEQQTELDAAMKAAKGGSVWQRTKRIAKWVAIAGGTGYVLGRVHK